MRRIALTLLLVSSTSLAQERPSLSTLQGISAVVASSAHPDIEEGALVRHAEERLRKAGLLAEPNTTAAGRLLVDVYVVRSRYGRCQYLAYDVALRLEESATLERSPGERIQAVTWRGTGRTSRFTSALPAESVMEIVDNKLNALIGDAAKDRTPR